MEPQTINLLVGLLVGLTLGLGGAFALVQILARAGFRTARAQAQEILTAAQLQADTTRKEADLQAKEESLRRREQIDREVDDGRRSLREQEARLEKRADILDEKLDFISKRERDFENIQRFLTEQQEEVQRKNQELKGLMAEQREHLLRLSGYSPDDARAELFRRLETELEHEVGGRILKHEQTFREQSQQKAREILATAIQRYASSHTAETTSSTVDIPSDDMKGRIIGREGRNIRAFEKATGVDVIVDDTPGVVIVTGFDNVRREIAKMSLEKLIQDGRIHPTRIEEVVSETQHEMDQHILTRRPSGGAGGQRAGPAREAARLPRPAQVPHQLLAERPPALDRGGVPHGHDGRGNRA